MSEQNKAQNHTGGGAMDKPDKLETLIYDIFAFNKSKASGDTPPIWPCLVGPHGEGKTSRVMSIARRLGLPVRRLTLQSMRPEDVGGYPRPIKNGEGRYVMKFIPLAAFYDLVEQPGILFLDELDKPHPETLSTILSVMTERQVSPELRLHPDTLIICAMQPCDDWLIEYPATRDALASRLVQLPVERDFSYVAGATGLDATELKNVFGAAKVKFYIAPTSSRTIKWVHEFLTTNAEYIFGEKKELLPLLLGGMLPEKAIPRFTKMLTSSTYLWMEKIAAHPQAVRAAIETWGLADLCRLFPYVLCYCDEPLWVEVFKRIVELDDSCEHASSLANIIKEFVVAKGGGQNTLTVKVKWFPRDPEEVGKLFHKLRREVELPYYEKLQARLKEMNAAKRAYNKANKSPTQPDAAKRKAGGKNA